MLVKPSFHKVVSCRYLSFGVFGVIVKDRERLRETENDNVAGIEQILSQRHCQRHCYFWSFIVARRSLRNNERKPTTLWKLGFSLPMVFLLERVCIG